MITLLLLVRATYIWVVFFAHIPFVVNRTFNPTPTERLQHNHTLFDFLHLSRNMCTFFINNTSKVGMLH